MQQTTSNNSITTGGETVVETAPENSTPSPVRRLLSALWRSNDLVHQVGLLNRHGGGYTNIPLKEGIDPVAGVEPFLSVGMDVYIAVAEYKTDENRTADNAAGAWALWLDIDVGAEKAAAGKGYVTIEEAKVALNDFCTRAGIPAPTHLVASGSGLHAYWMLTAFLEREEWKTLAKKFKALTQALGLRADPARTADIASILRIPGTLNYKTNPPKPVTLISASDNFIETEVMTTAILDACEKYCSNAIDIDPLTETVVSNQAAAPVSDSYIEPPNFAQLTSALKTLDPDCGEFEWTFHRIAPMANTAAEIPEIAERLYLITKEWSSGDLRGIPSKKWNTPGGNGLTGAQFFDRVWNRFLKGTYSGKKATLRTIFWSAQQAGWVWNYRDAANGADEVSL